MYSTETPWMQLDNYYAFVHSDSAAAAGIESGRAAAYMGWYSGYKSSNILLWQAAMIAIKTAIDLTIAKQVDKRLRDIAAQQRDLANRQIIMSEENHARYMGLFAPIEDGTAASASAEWNTGRYRPQYASQRDLQVTNTSRAYGRLTSKLTKKFERYCAGPNPNMIRITKSEGARMEVDQVNRVWRIEEMKAWTRDDAMWGRLHDVVRNGQQLPGQAAADIAAGIRTMSQANDTQAQATMGWFGALQRGATGLFNFGYGQLENQKRAAANQLPGMARGGFGQNMFSGITGGISYDSNSFDYGGQEFNPETSGSIDMGGDNSFSSDSLMEA